MAKRMDAPHTVDPGAARAGVQPLPNSPTLQPQTAIPGAHQPLPQAAEPDGGAQGTKGFIPTSAARCPGQGGKKYGALCLLLSAGASGLLLSCSPCQESGPHFCTYPNAPGFLRLISNATSIGTEPDSPHYPLPSS